MDTGIGSKIVMRLIRVCNPVSVQYRGPYEYEKLLSDWELSRYIRVHSTANKRWIIWKKLTRKPRRVIVLKLLRKKEIHRVNDC